MSKYTALNNFNRHLRTHFKTPFPCVFCGTSISADSYERHCLSERHLVDPKTCCVWCRTKTWRKGKKHENVHHLQECVQNFFAPSSPAVCSPPPSILASDSTVAAEAGPSSSRSTFATVPAFNNNPEFATRDFFGHAPLPSPAEYDVPERYLMRFDVPLLSRVTFCSETLNEAARIVIYYLTTTRIIPSDVVPEKKWYHLMIRRPALENFYRNMERFDDGATEIAPFYCHCRGGPFEEDRLNEHVHLIVATVQPHFQDDVWSRIRPDDRPRGNYNCRRFKAIASPLHLVNALGYVSRRSSSCQFGRQKSDTPELNHFYLNRSLPRRYKFPLAMLWESGVRELVDYDYQNYEPLFDADYRNDETGAAVFDDGRWKIRYRHLPGLAERLASIPLAPNFLPAEEGSSVTGSRLFLAEGVEMPLEEHFPEVELTPQEQFERARPYLERAEFAYFVFRRRVQRVNNKIRLAVDRAVRIKNEEMSALRRNFEAVVASKDAENDRLRAENDRLLKTIEELQNRPSTSQKRTRPRSDSDSGSETKCESVYLFNRFKNNTLNIL